MKDHQQTRIKKKHRRARRTRAKVFGTAKRPRVAVNRSLKHIYVQLINDEKNITLAAASDLELKKDKHNLKKTKKAEAVGKLLAQKAHQAKIKQIVFDRRGNKYTGRIKALAESMRKEGLEF